MGLVKKRWCIESIDSVQALFKKALFVELKCIWPHGIVGPCEFSFVFLILEISSLYKSVGISPELAQMSGRM